MLREAKRESLIALKATHTAHRVASEVVSALTRELQKSIEEGNAARLNIHRKWEEQFWKEQKEALSKAEERAAAIQTQRQAAYMAVKAACAEYEEKSAPRLQRLALIVLLLMLATIVAILYCAK